MEWIEVTARTVADAKELALDRLGVVEAELEYDVMEEPKAGFLGLGRTDARIRARVKPLSREKPNDRRRRRNGEQRRQGRGRRGESPSRAAAPDGAPTPVGTAGTGEGAGPARPSGARRRRRGGRGRSSGARGDAAPAATRATKHEIEDRDRTAVTEETSVDASTMTIEEQASVAQRFTEELVARFGIRAEVTAAVGDDAIEVRVDGEHLGVLVGPRGATLLAAEELLRAVVHHAAEGQSARLHLDVAGYRERRREALAAFARSIADEVLASGTPKALEPMAAPDRKVVHDTVAEIEGVTTHSEGEDARRRVVISPE
jgi:spoIIIJ-associated protein